MKSMNFFKKIDSKEYLETMTSIQKNLIKYIDDENAANTKEEFEKFIDFISKIKIQENKHEFKSFLYLLIIIVNNNHRINNLINLIEQILLHFKEDMKKNFLNSELFHIFKSNKGILLFLFEEKTMIFDEKIAKKMIKEKYLDYKYPQYFQPEFAQFVQETWFPKYIKWEFDIQQKIGEHFYERRKIGENHNFICKIIREDLYDDFIAYINKNNIRLDSKIDISICETNNFLLKKNEKRTTLIKYAVFYGSFQIFNYLIRNKISLTPINMEIYDSW